MLSINAVISMWVLDAVTPAALPGPAAVQVLLLLMATVLALCGIYGLLLVRRGRQLARLRDGAERFATGELNWRLPVEGPPDLARLAEALNRMAGQLDERLRHLAGQRNEMMAVLASMVEGVLVVDLDERMTSLNAAAAQLLDIDAVSAIGRDVVEVVRNTTLCELVARTLGGDQTVSAEIALLPTADGDDAMPAVPRCLQAQGAALRDAWGERIGGLIVLHDVTRLRQLERVRRDFVANVSHEIRTPISVIKAAAETLLDHSSDLDEDRQRFIQVVGRQADRLQALAEDLLSLARIEQAQEAQKLALTDSPLLPVLAAAVEACRLKAEPKSVRVELRCGPDVHAAIHPGLLEQAVVNLLDNAVKYSPENRTVTLLAERRGGQVVLEVRDQGIGIEAEFLPRLFERFYRTDRARSRASGGTGLGLAIVKHVAQAHNGQVSVQSTPGQGSVFRIHLPAC